MGLLLYCVYFLRLERYPEVAACFSLLVLSKHLFATLAPVIGVFLIKFYCIENAAFSFSKFLQLFLIVSVFLLLAFLPFAIHGSDQISKIISQLFPFGRGLIHAYWAPNIWSIYCFADKIFYMLAKLLKLDLSKSYPEKSIDLYHSSAGMVGNFYFAVLPQIHAHHCLLLTLFSYTPIFYKLLYCDSKLCQRKLVDLIVYASLSSFMLGYHVHENAIIIPIILQAAVAFNSDYHKLLFILMSVVGTYSLFPLFFTLPELILKGILFLKIKL